MQRVLLLCFLALILGGRATAADTLLPREVDDLVDILRSGRLPHARADFYRPGCKGSVDIRGVLHTQTMPVSRSVFPQTYLDYVMLGLDGAILVDGKAHALDFGSNPALREQARKLHGKRIALTGQIETRLLPFGVDGAAPRKVQYVLVTSITDMGESIEETTEIDLQGRLQTGYPLGFDRTLGTVVHVAGKTYVLDFSEAGKVDAAALNGKMVRLQGRLGAWHDYVGILEIRAPKYRVFHVRDVKLAQQAYIKHGETVELGGWIAQYRHILFGRAATGITVAGHSYWLDFGKSDALYGQATKSMIANRFVRVTGRLRASDGAIEVVNVEMVTTPEHHREVVRVRITGFLQEARLWKCIVPCSLPAPSLLQINVNGRVLSLAFPPDGDLHSFAAGLVGGQVIVHGRLNGDTVEVDTIGLPFCGC